MQHLICHNILHSHQSAHVLNKSTETALARINNDIIANDIGTIIVFNHSILINRLTNVDFTGN